MQTVELESNYWDFNGWIVLENWLAVLIDSRNKIDGSIARQWGGSAF